MSMIEQSLPADLQAMVERAIAEDVGDGDRNAALIMTNKHASARVIARENAILAGAPWFNAVFAAVDAAVTVIWNHGDGERLRANTTVCTIQGPVRALLTGERTALNFLQLLSGVASATSDYVKRVQGTNTDIVDTRKTLPGLRSAQKYAIRCGGGRNQRFGLFDAILINENHIMAAGCIADAVARAREQSPTLFLQVEVETLEELEQALEADIDAVLLHNFATHVLARAVHMADAHRRRFRRRIMIEASGDVSLTNVREIADTGVDCISIGGLTKHLRVTDFSMRVRTD